MPSIQSIATVVLAVVVSFLVGYIAKKMAKKAFPTPDPIGIPNVVEVLPSNFSPAMVYTIMTHCTKGRLMCGKSDSKLAATFLDFISRGILSSEIVKTDKKEKTIILTFNRALAEGKIDNEYEKQLLEFLFDTVSSDKTTLSLAEIENFMDTSPITASKTMNNIDLALEKEADDNDIFLPDARPRLYNFIASGIGIVLGLLCIILKLPTYCGFAFAFFGAFVPIIMFSNFEKARYGQRGSNEFAAWSKFRDYLLTTPEKSADDLNIAVWERYLAYAAALGVLDKIIEPVAAKYPQFGDSFDNSEHALLSQISHNGGLKVYVQSMQEFADDINQLRATAYKTTSYVGLMLESRANNNSDDASSEN